MSMSPPTSTCTVTIEGAAARRLLSGRRLASLVSLNAAAARWGQGE